MSNVFRSNFILTDAVVAFVLAVDVELGMVGAVRDADGGGSVTGAGIGITGGGGGGAVIATAWEAPLAIILFMSIGSDFIMGGCDMTTG